MFYLVRYAAKSRPDHPVAEANRKDKQAGNRLADCGQAHAYMVKWKGCGRSGIGVRRGGVGWGRVW